MTLGWCPSFRPERGGLDLEVRETLLDDRRVFDAGDDLGRPAAVVKGLVHDRE
jgi:hypothetical protein